MTRICISGASGRMGRTVIRLLVEEKKGGVHGAIERAGHPDLGRDAGELAGVGHAGVQLTTVVPDGTEALIDFSTPDALPGLLERCMKIQSAAVIGTTGLTESGRKALDTAAHSIPVIAAPNFSIGVNVIFQIAAHVAETLGDDFDIEIVEMHHRHKADAPSGTAIGIAERLAEARGWTITDALVHGRQGRPGPRPKNKIGMHAVRGGGETGEHSIIFASMGERVEIHHRALGREAFAAGAIRAAQWLVGKNPGRYSMKDVLGL